MTLSALPESFAQTWPPFVLVVGLLLIGVAAADDGLFAAVGGEDYELLVAMPAAFQGSAGLGLTRIGVISEGNGVELLQDGVAVTAAGFDHFA